MYELMKLRQKFIGELVNFEQALYEVSLSSFCIVEIDVVSHCGEHSPP